MFNSIRSWIKLFVGFVLYSMYFNIIMQQEFQNVIIRFDYGLNVKGLDIVIIKYFIKIQERRANENIIKILKKINKERFFFFKISMLIKIVKQMEKFNSKIDGKIVIRL